jgi:hypothetical protein
LEDKSKIGKNPGIMARIKSFALNILRRNGIRHGSSVHLQTQCEC